MYFVFAPVLMNFRDDTHMTSTKIVQFSRPPSPFVQLRPKFFHPLELGRPISKDAPSPFPNDNQSIKRKHNPWMTIICYQIFHLGRLSLSVSTQYGFPLTSFHLAEANVVPRAIQKN